MKSLGIGLIATAGVALAAPATADGPPMTVNYDNVLNCAAMYEIYSYDAEARSDQTGMDARLRSSDAAYGRAGMLGIEAGKSPAAIKAEMEAKVTAYMARPPQAALARLTTARCDEALGLKTP